MTPARSVLSRYLEEAGGHVIMDCNFKVIEVGPEYQRLSRARKDDLLGKDFLSTLTEPNDERRAAIQQLLKRSLQRTAATGETDKLPPYRCDVVPWDGGDSEERWWHVSHIAVLDNNDKLEYLVHRAEDITDSMVCKRSLMVQRRTNYLLFGLCILLIGLITFTGLRNSAETTRVANRTCQIQSQSLPGQHALSRVIWDANELLLAPVAKDTRVPPQRQKIARDMERDIRIYIQIINRQPNHRNCP